MKIKIENEVFNIKMEKGLFITLFLIFGLFMVPFTFGILTTITVESPTNATLFTSEPIFNITTNDTAVNTSYYFNGESAVALINDTTANTSWSNSSALSLADSPFDGFNNVTFSATNTTSTIWSNTSLTAGYTFFKLDSASPIIDTLTLDFRNTTDNTTLEGGNYLNFTFNASEREYRTIYVTIYLPNGTVVNSTVTPTSLTTTENRFVSVNISGADLPIDGLYQIEAHVEDSSARDTAGTNQSIIVTRLKADVFNLVTWNENITLSGISDRIPNLTSVSIYDNRIGFKNFTTFTIGTSTNQNVAVNESLNSTYLLPSSDLLLIRIFQTGAYGNTNVTLETGGWNLVGLVTTLTLNESMYATDAYVNITLGAADFNNVTYASWYNGTSGLFCSAFQSFTITSCSGFTVTGITIREDSGLWILTNDNMTVNRTLLT